MPFSVTAFYGSSQSLNVIILAFIWHEAPSLNRSEPFVVMAE